MPIDKYAEKEARAELLEIKEEWRKRVENIRDTRVSPREAKGYRNHIWQVKDGFRYRYAPYISMELFRESMSTLDAITTDVYLSLRKSQENYEMEQHARRLQWASVLGLGIIIGLIVAAVIFVVSKLIFNIEVPLCR